MNDRIRELRRAGWSERAIAVELGITRHRVRTALDGFRQATPVRGLTWVEHVGLELDRAKYREHDDEQLPLTELAYDAAEWLDERWDHEKDRDWQVYDVRCLAGSLYYVLWGVVEGSDPLVRIHARRARRVLAMHLGHCASALPADPLVSQREQFAEEKDGLP